MLQMPSTSQNNPIMVTVDQHSSASESNPCLVAGLIQNEAACSNSNDVPDRNVCITPNENIGPIKRQRKTKYGSNEQIYSVETKPKRSRTPKSKVNSIEIEQLLSLPVLFDDTPSGAVLPSSSQPKVPAQKAKRKSTAQIKKNAVGTKVKEEMKLKAPQLNPTIMATVEHSAANESNSNHESGDAGGPSGNHKGKSENVKPAKRQRRESVVAKPKRSYASKSKGNPIKIEQPLPLPLNDDVTGKL